MSGDTTTQADKRYQHFDANRNCYEHHAYVCAECIVTKGVPVRNEQGTWYHLQEKDRKKADSMLKEAFQEQGTSTWKVVKDVLKDAWGLLKKPHKREDSRHY